MLVNFKQTLKTLITSNINIRKENNFEDSQSWVNFPQKRSIIGIALIINDKGSREEASLKSDRGAQTVLGALRGRRRRWRWRRCRRRTTLFMNLFRSCGTRITFPLSYLKDLITVLHTGQSAFVRHHWTRHNKQKTWRHGGTDGFSYSSVQMGHSPWLLNVSVIVVSAWSTSILVEIGYIERYTIG